MKDGGWVTLHGPRVGDAPEWPLSTADENFDPDDTVAAAYFANARSREVELWEREWRRPQARVWEANGQEVEVAVYVRTLVAAEHPGASAAILTLLVRMQETLGISLSGMARNRWRIGPAAEEGASAGKRKGRAVARAKDRGLTVVRGGVDADAS